MPQMDITNFGSTVLSSFIVFWFYFACCVIAVTNTYRFKATPTFFRYTYLIPAIVRLENTGM